MARGDPFAECLAIAADLKAADPEAEAGWEGGGGAVTRPPASKAEHHSMSDFLALLGLCSKCEELAANAGIDDPGDFNMFTEDELVTVHKFKVGHVRKIFAAVKSLPESAE